ncbi:YwiC-like family protein [Corynebacterium breve]|uniref:YwiC-like family protein n=1 Tax=Corynebacterium breve TaxID=3049799 RepID=A0ABY8VD74_9CORY|nr:YwiC-like family protein [Corynebacterium breve]WIM67057.1 YwiC-like family protein [Corynebacterium breve]
MTITAPKAPTKKRKKGISAWVPNQHGAWAMLISPAALGLVGAVVAMSRSKDLTWHPFIAVPAILVAWFFGYFAFFAFGLVARARTARRKKQYLAPVLVYGPVSLVGIVAALFAQPQLVWWALFFAPLVTLAVWETLHGRARSVVSGVSTTIASAILLPVLVMSGQNTTMGEIALPAWGSAIFLALYFTGTIPMVKTMVREKGNQRFFYGSVAYHVMALAIVVALVVVGKAGAVASVLLILTMVIALFRAWWLPVSARQGRPWTARTVGMAEVPVLLVACAGVIATLI